MDPSGAFQPVADDDAVLLWVHVVPGAARSEVVGTHGDALKVRVAAPPVDGKANAALEAHLAERLDVARSSVEVVGGHTARRKRVRIAGATIESVASLA